MQSVNLDELYSPPSEMIQKAVANQLMGFHKDYLKVATFFCLATGSDRGLDCSPRGGPPGFVTVLDDHTVAYADSPGNNRIESMRNLQRDSKVGMCFIFPGLEIFLRINGRGHISTNPALLERFAEGDRTPKTVTVIKIDEVLLHCGKAVNRAKLWSDDSRLERSTLPSPGQMIAALSAHADATVQMGKAEVEQLNQHYDHAVRHDLY